MLSWSISKCLALTLFASCLARKQVSGDVRFRQGALLATSFVTGNSSRRSTAFAQLPTRPLLSCEMSSEGEVEKAQVAKDDGAPTIFDKIIAGDIPCNKLYEDDIALAFWDVNPQAPKHFLVIPKKRDGLTQLRNARDDQKKLLGHLIYVAQELGQKECPQGFRLVINDGKDGAQSVYHLHVHVMGGRQMKWPPG